MENNLVAVTKLADDQRAMGVVALPERSLHGHVNPMLIFCKTLIARTHDVHVTLFVKEHWLNANDFDGTRIKLVFFDAEKEEEEEVFEQLLDTEFKSPPDFIIADSFVPWAVGLGMRKKIPVASFWPGSASVFLVDSHRHLVLSSHSLPLDPLLSEERIDFIPGISSIRLADLTGHMQINDVCLMDAVSKIISTATKAQCIIFRTTTELEEAALAALKTIVGIPLYAVGPAIPNPNKATIKNPNDYMKWLDTQQENSVLYVSLGTYLSVSDSQTEELAAGVRDSGKPFFWVCRNQDSGLSEILGDKGIVVSWCDQMRVLSHSSVGGFVTHCGWNSTLEAAFAGVPVLTFPLGVDQTVNCKLIVEDWGIGWRLKNYFRDFVMKEQISELVKKFMDLESFERKELDSRCKKFKEQIMLGVAEDGSTSNLDELFSVLRKCTRKTGLLDHREKTDYRSKLSKVNAENVGPHDCVGGAIFPIASGKYFRSIDGGLSAGGRMSGCVAVDEVIPHFPNKVYIAGYEGDKDVGYEVLFIRLEGTDPAPDILIVWERGWGASPSRDNVKNKHGEVTVVDKNYVWLEVF